MNPSRGQPQYPQVPQSQHQRFSWQAPLADEAPAYEERPQPAPQRASHQYPVAEAASPRHYSYVQTPNELRAFAYTSSPNDPPLPHSIPISLPTSPYTPVDSRSQALPSPQSTTMPLQHPAMSGPPSYTQYENTLVSPVSPYDGMASAAFSPVSPMPQQQPIQSPVRTVSKHQRQMSNLLPIRTDLGKYPLPPIPVASPVMAQSRTPVSAGSTKKSGLRDGPISPTNSMSYALEPYSPHNFTSSYTKNSHAVFSPDSVHGPNGVDVALHQPGQIAHPNMEAGKSTKWKHSLCACSGDVSTCLTGLFCPCVSYGRTSYRLSQKSAKKDPTDMLGYSSANGHCMLMGLSCGLWWLFPILQRTRIRHTYKLEGSVGSDCLLCCCCCCVAVQNEREVKSREEANRRWAGPASTFPDAYTRTSVMMYKPQQ